MALKIQIFFRFPQEANGGGRVEVRSRGAYSFHFTWLLGLSVMPEVVSCLMVVNMDAPRRAVVLSTSASPGGSVET